MSTTPNRQYDVYQEAIFLRGLFIQRYSGIEFAISELIMRAREHPVYNCLGDLPWGWERKIKRIKMLIDNDGPIKAYSAKFLEMLPDFEEFEPKRHFLVHGIMTVMPDSIHENTLRFAMYDHRPICVNGTKSSVVHAGHFDITLEEFGIFVASLEPISTELIKLVTKVCREVPLPPLLLNPPTSPHHPAPAA
jgi:hypothetical protein